MKLYEIKNKTKKSTKEHYAGSIEQDTLSNGSYRSVLFTAENMQLVAMSIKPNQEIGMETHEQGGQFIRIEKGKARFIIDGQVWDATDGFAVVIPQGTPHNVINTGKDDLKLYAIYSPPEHPEGTVQKDKP